ncbi:hypothetical protein C8J57DRAFT_1509752 [Mycena rebaudengoi]|nr:hypothetical protein C8J57DRAFT_1509752 [Mycena rebaudengoi]
MPDVSWTSPSCYSAGSPRSLQQKFTALLNKVTMRNVRGISEQICAMVHISEEETEIVSVTTGRHILDAVPVTTPSVRAAIINACLTHVMAIVRDGAFLEADNPKDMSGYLDRIREVAENPRITLLLRFRLQDIIDLHARKWNTDSTDKSRFVPIPLDPEMDSAIFVGSPPFKIFISRARVICDNIFSEQDLGKAQRNLTLLYPDYVPMLVACLVRYTIWDTDAVDAQLVSSFLRCAMSTDLCLTSAVEKGFVDALNAISVANEAVPLFISIMRGAGLENRWCDGFPPTCQPVPRSIPEPSTPATKSAPVPDKGELSVGNDPRSTVKSDAGADEADEDQHPPCMK